MVQVVSLLTSVGTLTAMWMLSSRNRWGFAVGIGNQFLWGWLIWLTEAWGLIPLAVILLGIYVRGFYKWRT